MFIGLLIYSIAAYDPSCSSSFYCNELLDGKEIEITGANNDQGRYCKCSNGKNVKVKITVPSVSTELFCQSRDITKVTLDDAVFSIGAGAFYNCINLQTIEFPTDLISINEGAFESSGITLDALTFTGTNIGPDAFRYCSGLIGTLKLHPETDSQLSIGSSAFENTGISALSITGEVTSIGEDAFKDCTSLAGTVKIPGTVTSFGVAFSNTRITGITLGDGLSSIPTDAFKGISTLTGTVSFPNSVRSIGESAFEGTSITSIAFGDDPSLTIIHNKAFYGTPLNANGFNQIQLPSRLTSIGVSAFENSLFSGTITVGNSLTTINKNAFCNVSGLTCFSTNTRNGNIFPNTIKTIDDYAFDDTGLTGAISFGTATLTRIGKYAFEGLTITGSLKIELQDSYSVIDQHAFLNSGINEEIEISGDGTIKDYAFEGLTFNTLTISDATIDEKAFIKCTISQGMSFSKATINSDAFIKGKYTGTSDVLFYGSTVDTYAFNTFQMSTCTIKITDTTLQERAFESMIGTPRLVFDHDDEEYEDQEFKIGNHAFYGTRITGDANHNLIIPESVNIIDEYAFALCKGLTGDLIINSTIVSDYAFYYSGFTGLLRLNPNVKHLTTFDNQQEKTGNAHTFEGCRFDSLWLNNTGSIPNRAFYLMDSIKGQLYFPETIVSIGDEAFLGLKDVTRLEFEKNPNVNLVLSKGCFAKCSGISNNLEFDRKINNGDELIPNYAFYKCTKLPSITFHKELKRIGEYSFYECTALNSLDLPLELNIIGAYAFYGCSNLKGDLLIPPLITGQYVLFNNNYQLSLGSHVFDGCGFDKNLDASHLQTIPSYAFRQCKFINSINIPAATSIGSYAFYGCEGFTELHLYEEISSTSTINDHAFHGCSHLKTMTGFERVKTLSEGAFYGCSELTGSLNFHPDLGSISDYIFYDCKALDGTITWPDDIDEIGSYSFYGCSSLTGDLNLPEDVETVGEYAFSGCSKLTGPLIFNSIQYIKKYAFDGCSGLSGTLRIPSTFIEIERYAFNKCSGFSDLLHIDASNSVEAGTDQNGNPVMAANQPTIRHHAFNDCSGFKGGSLSIFIENEEEQYDISTYQLSPYYRYKYFLRIENDAFEGTKFKNVYYNGRFDPDCDYDIGISQIKGIHTSSNYANKTFCGNPIHKSKLSGGAIAGIVIACVVVVAIIVALIVFFILRNKKNKDQSEGEVEMNGDP